MKKFGLAGSFALGLGLIFAVLWTVSASGPPALVAPADELYVCPSGCAYASVQAAVDDAVAGDLIKVAGGTYGDVSNTGGASQVVYLTKTVTIQGGYTVTNWLTPDPEANPTTLDAGGRGRVFYITGDISPTLEGLRITGGSTDQYGGGILVLGARLTVNRTRITGNIAQDKGGGMAVRDGGRATVADCQIDANVTGQQEGGGVGVYGGSHMDLIRSWVVGNASPTNDGGGVFAGDNGSITIVNCIIAGNMADDSGGGISLGGGGPHRIVNSHIVGNQAGEEGGAVATYDTVQVYITNSLVISNTSVTEFDDEYGNPAQFLLSYCDTYGNAPDGTVGVIITRTDCLGSPPEEGLDPRLAGGPLPGGVGPAFAAQWLGYDYRPALDSPAGNAGTPIGAPATDIEGAPRIGPPTLGAYEWAELRFFLPFVARNSGP